MITNLRRIRDGSRLAALGLHLLVPTVDVISPTVRCRMSEIWPGCYPSDYPLRAIACPQRRRAKRGTSAHRREQSVALEKCGDKTCSG